MFLGFYLWWSLPELGMAFFLRKLWYNDEKSTLEVIADVLMRRFYRLVEWIEDAIVYLFTPETWIPYQLQPDDVPTTICAANFYILTADGFTATRKMLWYLLH